MEVRILSPAPVFRSPESREGTDRATGCTLDVRSLEGPGLNTTVEKLEGNRIRLTMELDASEVDGYIADSYSAMAGKAKIPGFRRGKAPRQVIDTYVGAGAVLTDALEEAVGRSYPLALEAEGLRPMDRPDTGELDGLEEGKPYTFSVEVDVRPELTLSSVKGLSVTVPGSTSTDAEVDAQIDYLRDRFSTLEVVEDRGIERSDFGLISFVGTVDGEPYEENEVDKYLYELGRGGMPPAFDEGLIGVKAGEATHIEFEVPDTSDNPEFVGKTAGFDVTVHEVKAKKLPEVDDEFAGNVGGFDTAADLRDDIRARLDENKATAHTRLVERAARSALAERLVGDIPGPLVGGKAEAMTNDFFETLKERSIGIDEYVEATGVQPEQIQADIGVEARRAVADELALEALCRQEGIELTPEEIDDEIGRIAAAEEIEPAEMKERLATSGVMPLVREQLMHRRGVRWLMENVQVLEEAADQGEAAPKADKKRGKKKPANKPAATDATEEKPAESEE